MRPSIGLRLSEILLARAHGLIFSLQVFGWTGPWKHLNSTIEISCIVQANLPGISLHHFFLATHQAASCGYRF